MDSIRHMTEGKESRMIPNVLVSESGGVVMSLVGGAMEPRVPLLSLQCPFDLQTRIHVGSLGARSISAGIPEAS